MLNDARALIECTEYSLSNYEDFPRRWGFGAIVPESEVDEYEGYLHMLVEYYKFPWTYMRAYDDSKQNWHYHFTGDGVNDEETQLIEEFKNKAKL